MCLKCKISYPFAIQFYVVFFKDILDVGLAERPKGPKHHENVFSLLTDNAACSSLGS